MNGTYSKLTALLFILMTALPNFAAADTTVRVLDLNAGAGVHGRGSATCRWCTDGRCVLPNNTSIVGLRRLFGREAVGALEETDHFVITLQELDVDTARNPGWDMPEYFRNRVQRYTGEPWFKLFLRSRNFQGGLYGIGMLANTGFYKQRQLSYAWNAASKQDWGCEPQVALAGKIAVSPGNVLWIVNTHLAAQNNACDISDAEAVDAASRQIWQVLGFMGRMDPDHPILLTGDFNIRQNGDHSTLGTSAAHKQAYESIAAILGAAGFEQLGYAPGDVAGEPAPCWSTDTCTFKPWNDYSKLDYIFLRDPHDRIEASDVMTLQPMVDAGCWLTDHKGLLVDLVFSD